MKTGLLIIVAALVIFSYTHPAAAQDMDKFDGETTEGWTVSDLAGGTPEGASIAVSNKALLFTYKREKLSALVHSALLTELRELSFSIQSKSAITLALALEDRDGASFSYPFNLAAGKVTRIRVRPSDFKLNDDSKVKKSALDPNRLGTGYIFLDLGAVTGAKGENTLRIGDVTVERTPSVRQTGDLVVEKPLEISRSAFREGNIVIKKGGQLKITAPRFTLRGNVWVEGGTVELIGGVLTVKQRFNHELGFVFNSSSRFLVRDAIFRTAFPLGFALRDDAVLQVDNTEFQGGLTCDAPSKSQVRLNKVTTPGEFIVAPGADISISDSKFVLIWLAVGPESKGKLSLPSGDRVDNWSAGHGFNVRVRDSTNMVWGTISLPGSEMTIDGPHLFAAGFVFSGKTEARIRDIQDRRKLSDYTLPVPDRKFRFINTEVTAWNFYAEEKSHVTIEDSTYGESYASGDARMLIRNSTCDGSGGYVSASDNAELRMIGCKVFSLVVASGNSTLILENCEVTGDIRVTGKATVKLINSRISGRVEKDNTATVIQQ